MTTRHADATDFYPTRKSTGEALLPRAEPVVHDGGPGPLSADRLRTYEEDGFLMLDDLVDRSAVDESLAELDRIAARVRPGEDPRIIREPGSEDIKSVFEVHAISPWFRALVSSPRLVDHARQILGSDVYVHQTRVNKKPGFDGTDFYWHSDFETWHAEDGMPRMRALTLVIALTDNTAINGPLMIIPGSHRTFVTCAGETPSANYRTSLVRQEVGLPSKEALRTLSDKTGVVPCLAPAGTGVVFDCNCMHGSSGNITPYARQNLFVVFNSVENALREPFSAPSRRPPFLAAREFTPVRGPEDG